MIIGLTGRAGAGKSTAVSYLKTQFSFMHIDLDRVGHSVLEEASVKEDLVATFGREIQGADGEIDRKRLGPLVFADSDALGQLNAIVHSRMKTLVLKMLTDASTSFVLIDGALLWEIGLGGVCESVLVLTLSEGCRDQLGSRYATIVQSQASEAAYRSRGNVLLENTWDDDTLKRLFTLFDAQFCFPRLVG